MGSNRAFHLHRRALVASATGAAVAAGTLHSTTLAQDGTPVGEPISGGRLRIGVQGDPTNLDPHLTVLAAAGVVIDMVYDGLIQVDADLQPQPSLAASWTVAEDGLTYTFTLRDHATFHNGRSIVADDVVYSFLRVQDPEVASPSASYAAGIASVAAVDDLTVTLTLSTPDASFLTKLGWWGMSIVPREAVEENGDLALNPVGSGAFVLDEYIPNSSLTLSRHDGYWDAPRPYLDGLEILIVGEDTSRTTALVSDTVDLIEQVPHKDIALLESTDGVILAGSGATNLRWLVFNLRKEPFSLLEFRQAVAAAIDRQPIIDSAVFGYGEPLVGLYPPAYWAGYQGEVPAQDLEAAAELLSAVTLPEGFAAELLTWSQYDFLSNTSVVVQEQLRQAGIEAEITPEENATYIERFFGGDFDIAVMGASGYMDPNEWLEQSLASEGPNNAAGYSNPALDELIAAGLVEQDPAARADIYQQAQQIVIDDAPWISLYTSSTYEGLQERVKGFQHMLSGGLKSITGVWLE
ncbi:MAG TPA: ABC transporter substrate-binding protein [Thermomicrobiales bacterium]|nr:ABC transporter substrate-binding protein [Thermomicrobiales bacterium]